MTPIEKLDKLLAREVLAKACEQFGRPDYARLLRSDCEEVVFYDHTRAALAALRTQGEQERAAIVTWLREKALNAADDGRPQAYNALHFAAIDIERGEHRTLPES